MIKDPAFLFYSSDFLTGCIDLTMEERGQYITLICLQHQKGHLNEKTIRLSVGNISDDVLKKFQTDDNGLLYNQRIEEEIEKRRNFNDSRRKNGSLGGRPKKPSGLPSVKPSGLPSENLSENENVNENINENDYKVVDKDKKKRASVVSEDWRPKEETIKKLEQKNLDVEKVIDKFINSCQASGRKYIDFDRAILSWNWEYDNSVKKRIIELPSSTYDSKKYDGMSSMAEMIKKQSMEKAMKKFGGGL